MPTLWPWAMTSTLDFQGQILKMLYLRNGGPIDMERKGCEFIGCYTHIVTLNPWPWRLILTVKFWKSRNSGMGGPINMERKGYESIGCYAYFVTLSYDLDLGFSRSNFETAVSKEWGANWHGTKEMWVDRMLDSHCDLNFDLTHAIDLGFWRSVFEIALSQEREGQSTWNKRNASR